MCRNRWKSGEKKSRVCGKLFALAFCLLLSLEAGGCVRQEKKNSEQHELEIKSSYGGGDSGRINEPDREK